jgi:cytochrome c oxidase assembly protein subunit 15
LLAVVVLQVVLGIATLLWVVPISLALLHQAIALLVLTVATLHAASLAPRRQARDQPVVVPARPLSLG